MSNLASYLNSKLVATTTPGGLNVTLKRVEMEALAMSGTIPLAAIEEFESLATKGDNIEIKDVEQHGQSIGDMINAVAAAALVTPAITGVLCLDPDNETLASIEDLDFQDRMWIFQWATEVTRSVARFPQPVSSANTGNRHDSAALRVQTVAGVAP